MTEATLSEQAKKIRHTETEPFLFTLPFDELLAAAVRPSGPWCAIPFSNVTPMSRNTYSYGASPGTCTLLVGMPLNYGVGVSPAYPSEQWGLSNVCTLRSVDVEFDRLLKNLQFAASLMLTLQGEVAQIGRLQPDWDGEGAEAFSLQTLNTAEHLVNEVSKFAASKHVESRPQFVPSPDGTILVKWIWGPKELSLTINDQTVEVQRWNPKEAYESEGFWEIPVTEVSGHLEWLTR